MIAVYNGVMSNYPLRRLGKYNGTILECNAWAGWHLYNPRAHSVAITTTSLPSRALLLSTLGSRLSTLGSRLSTLDSRRSRRSAKVGTALRRTRTGTAARVLPFDFYCGDLIPFFFLLFRFAWFFIRRNFD